MANSTNKILTQKVLLLLKREQELYIMQRAHERTASWLEAFHNLSLKPNYQQDAGDLGHDWAQIMVQKLYFQCAFVFRREPKSETMHISTRYPGTAATCPDTLGPNEIHYLRETPQLACWAKETDEGHIIQKALGLRRATWSLVQDSESRDYLFVAGFFDDSTATQFDLAEADSTYFTMLCQQVALMLRNSRLLDVISKEKRALSDLNEQYVTANQQLATSLETVKRTQDQLLQANKMSAVGQLAAGISHEVNNPIGVILGFAQGMERRLTPEMSALRMPVESIVREALRCKKLVQQLLTFSRTDTKSRLEELDLCETIDNVRDLVMARVRAENCNFHLDIQPVPIVMGNKIQLEQVLVNLANNALDEIPSRGTVTLRLSTNGQGKEQTVAIEVEDDGKGIDEVLREKIFEPFFTTKEVGKGTGLGLSIAYEIVKQHNGYISVHPRQAGGTIMRVELPVPRRLQTSRNIEIANGQGAAGIPPRGEEQ